MPMILSLFYYYTRPLLTLVNPLAGPPARGAEAGSDEENDPGAAAERHGGNGHFCEHGALACHGLP